MYTPLKGDSTVFVIAPGDSFISLDPKGWSNKRHISKLWEPPIPFSTISAIESIPHSVVIAVNGDGDKLVYAGSKQIMDANGLWGSPLETIGTIGCWENMTYMYDKSGLRYAVMQNGKWSQVKVVDKKIDAMGVFRQHVIRIWDSGRKYTAAVQNTNGYRHGEIKADFGLDILKLPPVLELSNFTLKALQPCDSDGAGEFSFNIYLQRNLEYVGKMQGAVNLNTDKQGGFLQKPQYIQFPQKENIEANVQFYISEYDLCGADVRMDNSRVVLTHVLEADWSLLEIKDYYHQKKTALLKTTNDCVVEVSYLYRVVYRGERDRRRTR
jgi:hypothetical protein